MGQAEREAAWLLREKYHGINCADYQLDRQRLKAGEPLAYLIGHIPFLDCVINLASRPLIPRPETEYWVEEVIKIYTKTGSQPRTILDLCAGSGCIGVALGKAFAGAAIDFVEIDASHHSTINRNCLDNQLHNPLRIFGGSLFYELPESSTYDLIVCNPPYIDRELSRVASSVERYEPALALYGGVEGSEIIKQVIVKCGSHLNPGGSLYLEHEPEQSQLIAKLGQASGLITTTHQDQYKTERFSRLLIQ